jgi:hypothetical protein
MPENSGSHRLAQDVDLIDQKPFTPPSKTDGKEHGKTGKPGAQVDGHAPF